ncbi:cytochrome C [Lysobacter enzymogenes]|uniref:cytochrome C n=1 Tax=Lysobacter enzymogenes TaxID=69 RepID=UPI0008956D23|nr:cytochrome C [Lysobacter enzymogenes]SDW98732.1 hypothetical protein SAMN05421681_103413 [Lysobacter enzymogenes]
MPHVPLHRSSPARGGLRAPAFLLLGALAGLLLLASPRAHAVASFARQTGAACADCHIGSYGPALTPYGMRFKLAGYTDSDGNGRKIPVSGQIVAARSMPARGDSTSQISELDLYLAGRISEHVGGYAKLASNNTGKDKFDTRLTEFDVRFAGSTFKLAGKDARIGVSVNNNPGAQDPIGVLPAASSLGPASAYAGSTSILNSSALSRRTVGTSVYATFDRDWYGELGTYHSMSRSWQDRLGFPVAGDPGKLSDTGYLRLAYMRDFKRHFFSAGFTALSTRQRRPRGTGPSNDIDDLGYDLTYQFLGDREHVLSLSYVNIYERRRYGDPLIGAVDPTRVPLRRGWIRDQSLGLHYAFRQRYGIRVAHMINTGSADPARYVPYGVPDTTSNLISLYWTPFGREDSYTSQANLRLSATWFRFDKFNGASKRVFGTPTTDADDLNQFQLAASVMF